MMKRWFIYLFAWMALCLASCTDDAADSGMKSHGTTIRLVLSTDSRALTPDNAYEDKAFGNYCCPIKLDKV